MEASVAQHTQPAPLDTNWVRAQFPSLKLTVNGHPAAFLDAPAGTQVPQRVIDAFRKYFETSNANNVGQFLTSLRTDEVIAAARVAMADLFNCTSDEVFFGPNMTTLTFALARGIGRDLKPGDEIVVTTFTAPAGEETLPQWILEERLQGYARCRDLLPTEIHGCHLRCCPIGKGVPDPVPKIKR